LYRDLTCTAER